MVEVGGAYSDYMRATGLGYGAPDRRRSGASPRGATAAALRAPRPDVVFATSPAAHDRPARRSPPRRRHRAPLVFEVRDLWPRAPIEMGALRNPAARAGRAGAGARPPTAPPPTWWRCRRGSRDGVVAAGVPPRADHADPQRRPTSTSSPPTSIPGDLRERLGLGDAFVASYFGTMGEANDLTQVVEAATLLRDRGENGVAFVLQGEGKRRPAIEDEVRRRGAAQRGAAARRATRSRRRGWRRPRTRA